MSEASTRLAGALEPARSHLRRSRLWNAAKFGALAGVQVLPKVALGLSLGFAAAWWIDGVPLFAPVLLPVLLALVPPAAAIAYALRSWQLPTDLHETAVLCDHAANNKDRWSAALEFAESDDGHDRSGAMRAAAVEDGIATLDRLRADLAREALPVRPRGTVFSALVAVAIALLPALLIRPPGEADGTVPVAEGPKDGRTPGTAPEAPRPDDPAGIVARDDPTEASRGADPAETATVDAPPPHSPEGSGTGAGKGAGAGGAGAGEGAPRQQPPRGASEAQAAGATQSSGAPGGGQGSAESENPAAPGDDPPRRPSRTSKGEQGETRGGEKEDSGHTPGGASRGGGRMTALGNPRSGFDTGSERDDDPEVDDEDVEDEQEETDQRGGVMPMSRDRRTTTSRELGISGDGPPNDGRGGPTPPKKSRGTASLVLGIRLPDQVRGQPNPGTAKTELQDVPPQARAAEPPRTAPLAEPVPSSDVQSEVPWSGSLAEALQRYHELLRAAGGEQ